MTQSTTQALHSAASAMHIAKPLLLDANGVTLAHLQQNLALMAEHAIDDADLYFQYTKTEGWSLEEGIVKSGSFSIEQGVGVRAIVGEKTAFAYSDDISPHSLMECAKATRTIAAAGQNGTIQIPATKDTTPLHSLFIDQDPILTLEAAEKVALLERVERYARSLDTRIIQVMASVVAEYDVVLVARLDGTIAADVRPLIRMSINVVAEQDGQSQSAHSGGGGRYDLSYFSDERVQSYAKQAVDQAIISLQARPAPAGNMTVVLGSGWPGVLLHEAIGHGLEGDFNRKGSSAFTGKIGQQVASKGVTVVDDGTLAHRRGSLNIDDEGTPTQCTTLIEDGILCGYLQDSHNARLMGMPRTGNARRESYASLTMPRMTNTYMLNGQYHPDEIIASVQDGIYAVNFDGGQVDITNGKFVFSTSEAYKIEHGKITYPIKGATLIGNGPDALTRVSMIGNDMALDSGVGVCGKEGQSVPVGVGQPTLKIDGLTVGGVA